MDIKQLNTFLALCKIQNFTKTADLLGYAQSSITAQIKQLEKELDVKLFERIGKSVSLTLAGKSLIPYATQMVAISSNMKELIAPSDAINGSINIGVAESLCIYRLPRIIKKYKMQHPNIDICLKLLSCDQFLPMLCDNAIDIAFTIGNEIKDASIISQFELPEPILMLSYPENPLTSKAHVASKDFTNEAFVLTEPGCCYRGAFVNDMLASNIKPKVILETNSIQAIKEISMSGLGICVLPQIAVTKEVENKELIPLAYKNNYKICSQLIYHKDKWISPLLLGFINLAKNHWSDAEI